MNKAAQLQPQIMMIECGSIKGTAFLYKPFSKSAHIYLITCKHSLFGEDEPEFPATLKCVAFNSDVQLTKENTLYSPDKQKDIAIILLDQANNLSSNLQLEEIKWIEPKHVSQLIAWGYPSAFECSDSPIEEFKLLKQDIMHEHGLFFLKEENSTEPNDNGHNDTSYELMAGASGSPAFIPNTNYLVGIFQKYEHFKRIQCVPIVWLNDLLTEKEPIWSIDAHNFITRAKTDTMKRFISWNEWTQDNQLMYFKEYVETEELKKRKETLLSALKDKKNARVIGISGLGKTRFVLLVISE